MSGTSSSASRRRSSCWPAESIQAQVVLIRVEGRQAVVGLPRTGGAEDQSPLPAKAKNSARVRGSSRTMPYRDEVTVRVPGA